MSESLRTDRNPQPGAFDTDLTRIDPRFVDAHRGNPDAKVRIVISIEGEDAERLQRISAERGEKPTEVIAELLRDADRPAA